MPDSQFGSFQYQVGGSLSTEARSYVQRQADKILYDSTYLGEFCYILAARQMGKSSLRVRTMERLQRSGVCCGVLDMTVIGVHGLTPTQWYASIIRRLIQIFRLPTQFRHWWKAHSELSPIQCLSSFLEEELLAHIQKPIVLFIDEIDTLLQLDFSTDDFFALIRACFNNRTEHHDYRRLTFVLIGVAIPSDLISNPIATPFNIGREIVLKGLDIAEAEPLKEGFQGLMAKPKKRLEEILSWTGGQPFLTQKICQLVVEEIQQHTQKTGAQKIGTQKIDAQSVGNNGLQTEDVSKDVSQDFSKEDFSTEDLEALIRARVIESWELQDRPEHLRTVRDRLLYHTSVTGQVLDLYQQLLTGNDVPSDESLAQIVLRLSGLVVDVQGTLAIANPIYQAVFDQRWVAKQLLELRPYGVKIERWAASKAQEPSQLPNQLPNQLANQLANQSANLLPDQLLKGQELQAALAWAADKRLGDLDYRFLAASQEAERQAVERDLRHEIEERARAEFALQAATEAAEILATVRQQVRQQARSQMTGFRKWFTGITLGVASVVVLVRWAGILQSLELGLLDQFFRWRPALTNTEAARIVIVTIDEPDIQKIGQFPIPDQVLAQALATINQANPRLIGLDIYRDIPVEPGHAELVEILRNTPNLIGIEKVIGTPIASPPALAQTQNVGFADQLFDNDGAVRRTLLSVEPAPDTLLLSFPFKLALAYLETEGIRPDGLPQSVQSVQLGEAVLKPVLPYDGSYIRADAGGYQLLLNYVGSQAQFPTLSLTQVLNGEVPDGLMQDRIVLIGSVASTVNDLLITPYNTREIGSMAGVTIHANTISMLLKSALDDRALLQGWLEWQEVLWIVLFAATGGWVAIQWRGKPRRMTVIISGLLVLLLGGAYGLFLVGWWIPILPAGISLMATAILLPVLTARNVERAILQQMAKTLYQIAQEKPAVGKIAIAYLKQSESKENQAWIETVLSQQ